LQLCSTLSAPLACSNEYNFRANATTFISQAFALVHFKRLLTNTHSAAIHAYIAYTQAQQQFASVQCAPLSDAPLVPSLPITAATTTATAAGTALAAAAVEQGGSGGYLEHLFRHTAAALYGVALDAAAVPLRYKQGRNADFQEVELEVNGQVVLRGALAYGFRNMQVVGLLLLLCCDF
jgi:hypothetical protein